MLAVVAGAALSLPSLAAQRRVLIPLVASDIPGAYATRWSTRTWVHNLSAEPQIVFFPRDCPIGCADELTIAPHASGFLDFPANRDGARPGRFVHAEPGVYFSSRLAEEAGSQITTTLPTVPESEFARRLYFPMIPFRPESRFLLRVYGLGSETQVRVTVYRISPHASEADVVIGEHVLDLVAGRDHFEPAFAQLGDNVLSAGVPDGERIRVTVESLSDSYIWAFASGTDIRTQQVDLILPASPVAPCPNHGN